MTSKHEKTIIDAAANAAAEVAATRGRKPGPAATAVAVSTNHLAVVEDLRAADTLTALQAGYGAERDLLNQLLGQAQAFHAAGSLLQTFGVSKLAYVKETKLYQQLKGQRTPNGLELKGTWEEFCGLLGLSDEKANQDIANLNAFGEEALESMSRMGIGYRELRQYRKLPEDEKQALIEVAKAGDKEGFVDLAEEIFAKHAREKSELAAQSKKDRAELAAKDRVLTDNSTKINEQAQEIELLKSEEFVAPPRSVARTRDEQKLLTAVTQSTSRTFLHMRRVFLAADAALSDSGGNAPEAIQHVARQAVEFLAQQLADMAEEFDIRVDLESRINPGWLDEDALAVLEARGQTPAQ